MSSPAPSITLILGGARSGKTAYALAQVETLAAARGLRKLYLATAEPLDAEMRDRIRRHQAERGADWTTLETPQALSEMLLTHGAADAVLLVDCLTLWLSNRLLAERGGEAARRELVEALGQTRGTVLLVSNEVGQGIVPDNALARRFRDEAGWLHQAVAEVADRVVFITAGLPQTLKG